MFWQREHFIYNRLYIFFFVVGRNDDKCVAQSFWILVKLLKKLLGSIGLRSFNLAYQLVYINLIAIFGCLFMRGLYQPIALTGFLCILLDGFVCCQSKGRVNRSVLENQIKKDNSPHRVKKDYTMVANPPVLYNRLN